MGIYNLKTAILTLVSGDFFESLFSVSGPLIEAYAKKIGATLIVNRDGGTPGYNKLPAIRNALKDFDRVCYMDADILIRQDAPNIFGEVPQTAIGLVNEGRVFDRTQAKINWMQTIQQELPAWLETPDYFNTGVMVVSRCHAKLFADAPAEIDNFYEQTYLNFLFFDTKTEVFKLGSDFNRILGMIPATGRQLDDCYFSHFAGAFKNGSPVEANLAEFKAQAERFTKYGHNKVPYLPRRVYVETAGAVGDVVATEPVVRYIREHLFPGADLVVKTCWPEVFAHLASFPGSTKILGEGESTPDLGHYRIHLMPKQNMVPYNQFHPVDFASLMGIQGVLPWEFRRIRLKADPAPYRVPEHVLVHPGRSWQSKTFPAAWWNSVINGLKLNGFKVAVIGKDVEADKGTVDVNVAGCLDLRNKLTLPELFGTIAESPLLISNDSAPVHISGAFDNHTILVPTCKHPDYLVPHRDPSLTHILGVPLQRGPQTGVTDDINMDICPEEKLLAALPSVSDVVEKAIQLRKGGKLWK